MRFKSIILMLMPVFFLSSCGIGPIYTPELTPENSGLVLRDKNVVVTRFYKAQSELSYLGDTQISQILESAKLYDMSFDVANHLKREGLNAYGMKNYSVDKLKADEVLLSGAIITRSIPMEENFPIPGMLVVILVGNILPTPIPFKSGIDLKYRYELVDSSGKILQAVEKTSRIFYKDHYVWGRIFKYQSYEKEIKDRLEGQIYDLLVDDLFLKQ